jgi:hypothetical protein
MNRNRARVAGGALLLAVCTLGAVVVYSQAGDRKSVLAMARTVEVGDIVEAGDLRAVRVSSDPGVRTVASVDRSRVVGRPAAVRLVAGSLLSPAEVGEGAGLPDSMALIGAVLKAGQFPIGLAPGDTVSLVESATPTGAMDGGVSMSEPPTATVVAVEPGADGSGNTSVSLQLPTAAAKVVAGAGAAGRLNLIVVDR